MRVVAGKAKGHKLKSVENLKTRPTLNRIKETVFNIIQNKVKDRSFLDLFSGSGAIAIEALSRGAKEATLVEKSSECVEVIEYNLKHTKLFDLANVVNKDVLKFLDETSQKYDIIYIDPPYNKGLDKLAIEKIFEKNLLNENGFIILEKSTKDKTTIENIKILKEKKYKTTTIQFIKENKKSEGGY